MPDLVTAGATALPLILRAFSGGTERVDPQEQLRRLIGEFNRALEPAGQALESAAVNSGAITGSAVAQNVASATGRIGGGAAGTTRTARALASSAGSTEAIQGAAQARATIARAVAQLAAQSLPSAINAPNEPPTGLQNFLTGLAGVTAADGENPLRGVINAILKSSGEGESPFTADDLEGLSNLLNNPNPGAFGLR